GVVGNVAGRVDVHCGRPVEVVRTAGAVGGAAGGVGGGGGGGGGEGAGGGVELHPAPPVGGGPGTRNQGSLSNIPPRLMTARSTFRSRSVSSAARSSLQPVCREKIRPR